MIAVLALALAAAPSADPAEKDVEVKTCERADEGRWEFVRDQQMGVEARAHAEWLGLTAATDGFHDWAPLDDYKTTICGQLARFGIFEPTRQKSFLRFLPEIPEHDWNIILVPTRRSIFDERFKLAIKLMERGREGDLLLCPDRKNPCFEAEVTPQDKLLKANTANQWMGDRRLGQRVCVFGPWVGDGGHGFRPEIHPSERIWWRAEDDRLKLLFVQDASQRFGDRRQFQWKWGPGERGNWRPWAGAGLQGDFRIAFQASGGATVSLGIEQLLETGTRPVGRSAGEHLRFRLRQNDEALGDVEVTLRPGPRSESLKLDLSKLEVTVQAQDVCRRRDGTVQGYVTIHHKVGYGYQEGEGFDAFEVTLPALPEVMVPESVKGLEREATEESLHASVQIVAVEEDTGIAPRALHARLRDHLLRAAFVKREATPEQLPEARQAEARENIMLTAPADVAVGFTRRFKIAARPHYDGPRGERLVGAINRKRPQDLEQLLSAAPAPIPYKVVWDVRVRDVTADADLPEQSVTRKCSQRLLLDDTCALELPASGAGAPSHHVLHVSAKATLVDRSGNAIPNLTLAGAEDVMAAVVGDAPAEQEIRLASHFILADSANAEKVFAWLAAVNPKGSQIVSLGSPPKDERPPDREERPNQKDLDAFRRVYHARMLRHGVVLATTDGRLTIDELAQLVAIAADFDPLPTLTKVQTAPKVK